MEILGRARHLPWHGLEGIALCTSQLEETMAPLWDTSSHKGREPVGNIRSPETQIPRNEMIYEVASDIIRATLRTPNQ
jgi:hypothetical protein